MDERELDRFWNDLVAGRPPDGGYRLDPAAADAVRRFRRLAGAAPSRSARARVGRAVAAEIGRLTTVDAMETSVILAIAPPVAANGHHAPAPALPRPRPVPHRSARRALDHAALAALLLLALVAGAAALGPPRAERPGPAAVGEPAGATPTAAEVGVQTAIDALPGPTVWAGIVRNRFEPGADVDFASHHYADLGFVEAGTIVLRAEGPARVTRAGNGATADVAAGTEAVLGLGDGYSVAHGTAFRLRAAGTAPATLITAGIGPADPGPSGRGFFFSIIGDTYDPPVALPAVATLRQVAVAAGATLPAAPPGELIVAAPADPAGNLLRSDDGYRNPGTAPLAAYVLTVAPAPGDPVAYVALDAVVTGIPGSPHIESAARYWIDPAATGLTVEPLGGPQLWAVARGMVEATVGGTVRTLGRGDRLAVPADQGVTLHATGPDEAIVDNVVLTPTLAPALWDFDPAVVTYLEVVSAAESLPSAKARVVLKQLTLPPGTSLAPLALGDFDWLGVEEGALGLSFDDGQPPYGWQRGEERTLYPGQSQPLPAPGARATLRNAGSTTLVVFRLTVEPQGPGSPTPEG
jgi:mannose-6-phosphate isomerase-like protein (cupin superfamily)